MGCRDGYTYQMNAQGIDLIRRQVSTAAGEPVYFAGTIYNVIRRLGGNVARETIKARLAKGRVTPEQHQVSAGGLSWTPLYRERAVWEYLQWLESRGRIKLPKGADSFSDVFRAIYGHSTEEPLQERHPPGKGLGKRKKGRVL